MRYGDDPQVVELVGLLSTAIGQRLQAELGVQFRRKVKTHLNGYIIEFTAEVPNSHPARRWAAEMRGEFRTLIESAQDLSADVMVADQVAVLVAMWRRDNAEPQAGVDHETTISR